MSRPLALAVVADLPHPPRGGNDLRYAQNLRLLDNLGFDVRVVAGAARTGSDGVGVGPHARLHRTVPLADPSPAFAARLGRLALVASGALRPRPVGPWSHAHRLAGFDDAVREAADELRPAVVLLRSLFAYLAPELRRAGPLVVIDAHDAEVLQAKAMVAAREGAWVGGLLRVAAARQAERMLSRGDELWAASPPERDRFERAGAKPVLLVRNGIEVSPTPPQRIDTSSELVLVGNYGYGPNLAAARVLIEEVLPRVHARRPDAVATLVGRDLPSRERTKWAARRGVTLTGVVDEAEPYLRRAAALVFLPNWSTGTPLKIAEALATGLPVVSNTAGIRGLGLTPGRDALVADDPDVSAAQVVELLGDRALGAKLARAGHAFASANLSFEAVIETVERRSLLARLVDDDAARANPCHG